MLPLLKKIKITISIRKILQSANLKKIVRNLDYFYSNQFAKHTQITSIDIGKDYSSQNAYFDSNLNNGLLKKINIIIFGSRY